MVLREMTQLGNDDEERRAYELWDKYQNDCDWDAYDHHDHQDECNVSMEVEGFKFEGYGFMDPYGAYKEVESMDCTLPSGRVINVYPGNHPGIAPEANNETNNNTMANKVSMNEDQLRDKVYKMVCESFEALMAEGKTFKDQKAWGNKGFQKQNKFQKTDKYKNWKNGGNMNSDTDECMNEEEDKGYKVIEKGDGMFPKKIQLNGKDGREGFEKLCKSKQFVKPNSETDECMNEGLEEVGFMDKMKGAVGGFRQGATNMDQTGNKAIIGQAASDCLPYIQRAMNFIQQGATREALSDLTMVYNLIGRWAKAFGMEPNYAPAQRPAGPGNPTIPQA